MATRKTSTCAPMVLRLSDGSAINVELRIETIARVNLLGTDDRERFFRMTETQREEVARLMHAHAEQGAIR